MYPVSTKTQCVTLTEDMVPMSDGVRLYTSCAVAHGIEKCPVVYIRTPYEKARDKVAANIESY